MKNTSVTIAHDDRFLRMSAVVQLTGVSRAHVYFLAKEGRFPRPYKLSQKSSAWLLSELTAWMQERVSNRQEAEAEKVLR